MLQDSRHHSPAKTSQTPGMKNSNTRSYITGIIQVLAYSTLRADETIWVSGWFAEVEAAHSVRNVKWENFQILQTLNLLVTSGIQQKHSQHFFFVIVPSSLPLFSPDGITAIPSTPKAELFAHIFTKNLTLDDSGPYPFPFTLSDSIRSAVKVLHNDVLYSIFGFHRRKTYSPDGVHPFVLTNCVSVLTPSLVKFFRLSPQSPPFLLNRSIQNGITH